MVSDSVHKRLFDKTFFIRKRIFKIIILNFKKHYLKISRTILEIRTMKMIEKLWEGI